MDRNRFQAACSRLTPLRQFTDRNMCDNQAEGLQKVAKNGIVLPSGLAGYEDCGTNVHMPLDGSRKRFVELGQVHDV